MMVRYISAILLLGAIPFLFIGSSYADPAPANSHQLLTLQLERGQVELLARQVVSGPLPKRRNKDRPYPWRVRLLDPSGRAVFSRGMSDPSLVRGEFHHSADATRIEGHHLKHRGPVTFTVRIPALGKSSRGMRLEVQALSQRVPRQPKPPAHAWLSLALIALDDDGPQKPEKKR